MKQLDFLGAILRAHPLSAGDLHFGSIVGELNTKRLRFAQK
jgi:hypothetical protein